MRRSEGERETAAAQAARRRGPKAGSSSRLACLLFVCCSHFSARERLKGDRLAGGPHPLWRGCSCGSEGCYFVLGNVIEVEELRKNRRELLLEEEQGFPRRLVLLCLL